MLILKEYSEDLLNKVTNFESVPMELSVGDVKGYGVTLNIDVNTPSAGVFTADSTTDSLSDVAHEFTTGLKVQLTTTTTLPSGLSLATDYFVIVVSNDTYRVATSLANALAGTYVNFTDNGTGTHTATPVALAGGTYKIQLSIDGSNYVDLAAATNITADAGVFLDEVDPLYNWIKVVYTLTAGRISVNQRVVVKGDE